MPRKPKPEPDDAEQSLEIAEEVGADADDEALERAFKKFASPPKKKSS